ncbi:16S rRNA (cytosine(1402)-N(4))-methyltransferase RsmH [Ancylobacter amanitiformis]|uniref:Ribosomal RNA small subunit methyltransferase H n=1 Tax=Ancylobacter amanitiformis TaxID=217069 RepID=A0ABU0LND5_9HYPH|nr:16S rRNA (cytosine(1402)-N(4))-methyltransferase RsmH [Ancylobacter amanitiformis]MDQ0510222.1 16S rRNA (cytosine1402-N4)-methyltransferase [Ancylobacter amanitiformis]
MMAGRGGSETDVAGGPARHLPVLLDEVIDHLAPRDGGVYVDGTFGAGGYTRAILAAADARVIAIDRDPNAIADGQALVAESGGRLTLVHERFSALDAVVAAQGLERVDGVVLDIGVSSMQIDEGERGFSFRRDGPLDMRMSSEGPSAADLVAKLSETDLANLLYRFGEERRSRAVARAIVEARASVPIERTLQLADIVAKVIWAKPHEPHPSTRTFQALRIAVNDELGELARALEAAERVLKPGGRLVVVTFHSLEDRIVKNFLANRAKAAGGSRHLPSVDVAPTSFRLVARGAVEAGEAELAANPRARSAKLRAAERTEAPAHAGGDLSSFLPPLPSLDASRRR